MHAQEHSGNMMGYSSVPRGEPVYVFEIDSQTGLATPTVFVNDIEGALIHNMGHTAICPVPMGACVTSTTGGLIQGFDAYGEYIEETVAGAGTSTIAFAAVTAAPTDAEWVNQFGLPYKRLSGTTTGITYTIHASDEDERGTFVVDGGVSGPTEIELSYIADKNNPFGDSYATRYASGTIGDTTLAVTATIDAEGDIVVTLPTTGGVETPATVTFPDGRTIRGVTDDTVSHRLSPLYLSKYRDVINTDAFHDRLVAVAFDNTDFKAVYADVTGSLTPTLEALVEGEGTDTVTITLSGIPAGGQTITVAGIVVDATAIDDPDPYVVIVDDTLAEIATGLAAAIDGVQDAGTSITVSAASDAAVVTLTNDSGGDGEFDTAPTVTIV